MSTKMTIATPSPETLVAAVVAAFQRFSRLAEEIHGDDGFNAGDRSILLALSEPGNFTVASLARKKDVSRQFMHRAVGQLREAGLVTLSENPRHARSPHLALSEQGRLAVSNIRARELPLWNHLAIKIGASDVNGATQLLRLLASVQLPEQER